MGPTIQARSLARALNALDQLEVDSECVLNECRLSREMLSDPDRRISFRAFAAFYEAAAKKSGHPDFGLRVGAQTHLGAFDVLGYAALSCATVRDALGVLRRYFRVLEDGGMVDLTVAAREARLAYRVALGPHATRQLVELGMAVILRWLQSMLGEEWYPSEVRFAHSSPDEAGPYLALFRAPVYFGSASNEIVFEVTWLDHEIASADSTLERIMERHLDEMLAALPPAGDG